MAMIVAQYTFAHLEQTLSKYVTAFSRLKRGGTRYGLAPHKPVLLLSLIELTEKEMVQVNEFPVTADLVGTFKENWGLLVPTLHQPDFTQPYFYLQSEKVQGKPFWELKPNPGCQINSHIRSVARLSEVCAFGYFAQDLFLLLIDSSSRSVLKEVLLETYFKNEKVAFYKAKGIGDGYLHDQVSDILNEPEAKMRHVSKHTEEDVFVRNGLFKKMVPKIYGNRCCFTGMQLSSTFGHSFVDACHIVPFSLTHNDKVTNGIALCPNLHRAFDRGLVGIDENYNIIVSEHVLEDTEHSYGIGRMHGKPMALPKEKLHYPAQEYIGWHRENLFKR